MQQRDIIVIGASAGGVEVLLRLVSGLPAGLPAAVFITCHTAGLGSQLPQLLSARGTLLATHVQDGTPIYPGHIYVAPPDFHMMVEKDRIRLSHGPRENRVRPAIDPLFRSAARAFGPRVIGVLLTGSLSDGVSGLMAIRNAGGLSVVQDPADSLFPYLPDAAIGVAGADHVARVEDMAALLVRLMSLPSDKTREMTMIDPLDEMPETVEESMQAQVDGQRRGDVSVFTCPECGGSLWQVRDQAVDRFRCHVGHAYSGDVLLEEQSEALEAALWTAVRTFKEKCILARQLAQRERALGHPDASRRFEDEASVAQNYADLIQQMILRPAEPAIHDPNQDRYQPFPDGNGDGASDTTP